MTCHADRQSALGDERRHIDARHAHQGPQPVEAGIAGRRQSVGGGARRRERQQHIDVVENCASAGRARNATPRAAS